MVKPNTNTNTSAVENIGIHSPHHEELGDVVLEVPLDTEEDEYSHKTNEAQQIEVDDDDAEEEEEGEGTAATFGGPFGVYEMLLHAESNILEKKRKPLYHDADFIKLCIMVFMVGGFFFAELIVGIIAGSLTLLADSFHMLSDGISLFIAIIALLLGRKRSSKTLTYGYGRAEILGAMINAVFLLSVVMFIFLEAFQRFLSPEPVSDPLLVLIVGGIGMLINVIGMIMFCGHHHHGHDHDHDHGHGHDCGGEHHDHENEGHDGESNNNDKKKKKKQKKHKHKNENIVGVFLHIMGDFFGSIGVMISSALLLIFPGQAWTIWVDPILSIIIACIILVSAVPLVIRCTKILLQSVPKSVDIHRLEKELTELDGVLGIHELHVWALVSSRVIGTVHVTCEHREDFMKLGPKIKEVFHRNGVHSSTIQPEYIYFPEETRATNGIISDKLRLCELVCSQECFPDQCCPPEVSTELRQHIEQERSRRKRLSNPESQQDIVLDFDNERAT